MDLGVGGDWCEPGGVGISFVYCVYLRGAALVSRYL